MPNPFFLHKGVFFIIMEENHPIGGFIMKKYLALFLALVTLLGIFAGCGKTESAEVVLPVQVVEETTENRQKALIETAWAYWYKNPYVQYDWVELSVLGKEYGARYSADMCNTPEMAGPQRNTYACCVYYTHLCTYHTFDYKMDNRTHAGDIHKIVNQNSDDPLVKDLTVFRYDNNPDDPEGAVKAMNEMRALLQPGDLIMYLRTNDTGHAVMWCGDLNGDGLGDILNVDGKRYESATGVDPREDGKENGAVDINTDNFKCPSGEYFFFDPKAYDYVPKFRSYTVLRVCDRPDLFQMTERAKTRFLYPGLETYYEVDGGIYSSVTKGEELTYTLTVTNNSTQDHKGLLAQIPVPEGAELVAINGQASKGKLVKLTLDIPAGETAQITITVKATGEVGSKIVSDGAYLHAIPLPKLITAIRSAAVDGNAVKAAAEKHTNLNGMEFANAVCGELNQTVTLPELGGLKKALYSEKRIGESKVYQPLETVEEANLTLQKMVIENYVGGMYYTDGLESLRVTELRAQDLQAGDILIWEEFKGDCQVAVHDGTNLLRVEGGKVTPMTQADLDRFLIYRFFIALRPVQAV